MPALPRSLEIHGPDHALESVEAFLRAHGFFGTAADAASGQSADVYLGYALSRPWRRSARVDPPEPARLPVAACRIRGANELEPRPGPFEVGPWQPTWTALEHAAAVQRAREAIAAGEVYQVNLVQHLAARFRGDPWGVARALAGFRPLVPRPFSGSDWAVVSASPELFLARRGSRVWTMPIKGTRPAGEDEALRTSAKDAAEHVMIVDLERNDLGRVCRPNTIRWPVLMESRPLAGVQHLVSTVEGRLQPGISWATLMAALFPGGSVTGAPKVAALDHIAALEPVGRGAAMGALGRVWPNGDLDMALTIRTFAIVDEHIHLWVGGGVVWDSDPTGEVEEAWVKARPLLAALRAPQGSVAAS